MKCATNDIIGLLGKNGSGKSTLLKVIFGIVSADHKFIRINGVVKSDTHQLLKEISYLPQENFIPNHFTVKMAISLSLDTEKSDHFCNDKMIQSILPKRIRHLSSGELRYLEIKLVLFNPSKFVLLDEPYNGLSPLMIETINQLIVENAQQKGIIITDHNYENVIRISTQLVLMRDGKTNTLKSKNELIEKGYLNEGML
ncbi:ATP-binding cassette domain-containing protein [Flavobacterium psychrotolerans]|uniref:ATP-binding cassette domain-containing protein n=1 Tax=Flavobacterium psychrotolerans TaxID=2169410 RepID=UPI001FB80DFC|nr:ATP-binding cassette domain-containing protein [Flavobacterium psychrotolerans]